MNKFLKKQVLAFVLIAFISQIGLAQTSLKLQSHPKLKVSGTSSLHDWEMPSTEASGSMEAVVNNGKLTEIHALEITMPAESIKSGKKGMDKKAYEALKTDKHKQVVFKLKSATTSGNNWMLNGTFHVAGMLKNVRITAAETSSAGEYGLKGEYQFKLSDFDITPPTALMGTIKTGDEVKISFDVKFK